MSNDKLAQALRVARECMFRRMNEIIRDYQDPESGYIDPDVEENEELSELSQAVRELEAHEAEKQAGPVAMVEPIGGEATEVIRQKLRTLDVTMGGDGCGVLSEVIDQAISAITRMQSAATPSESDKAGPVAFVHWPTFGRPRLVWYGTAALQDAINKAHEGPQSDLLLYAATPSESDKEDAELTDAYAEGRGDQFEDDCAALADLFNELDSTDAIGDGFINTTRVRELLNHFDMPRAIDCQGMECGRPDCDVAGCMANRINDERKRWRANESSKQPHAIRAARAKKEQP